MMIIFGILIGLLLAVIVFLAVRRYQVPIERTIAQLENKTKQKGAIFVETDEDRDLEDLLDNLPIE